MGASGASKGSTDAIELRVLGCHGGETPKHRPSAFLIDGRVTLDAGAITGVLGLDEQARLEACLVSHAHLDHIRDLATLVDNRCQLGGPPLEIAGSADTIEALKRHFFNGHLWPDFSSIPSGDAPTLSYRVLPMDAWSTVAGLEVRPVPVSHTIDCTGFVVARGDIAFAYSGDTGPTDRLWEVLNAEPRLRALLVETSFPDAEAGLAAESGHLTPATLKAELQKLRLRDTIPALVYHIKPTFQKQVEHELAQVRGLNLTVQQLGDVYRIG